jgi:hypothetical protein
MNEMNQSIDSNWMKSYSDFYKALQFMENLMRNSKHKEMSNLELLGLIHSFEKTCDFLMETVSDFIKHHKFQFEEGEDFISVANKFGILDEKELWYELIEASKDKKHIYDDELARAIADEIAYKYYFMFGMFNVRMQEIIS